MDKKEFNALLKRAGLNKKEFAGMIGLEYRSVANWGGKDKPFPKWVKPFLDNYIKANTLESAFNSVKDVICTDKGSGNE